MNKGLLTFAMAFILCRAHAQTLEWVKQIGGEGNDRALAITTDASGNCYTTGLYQSLVDFDPGTAGTDTLLYTSTGSGEAFILKLDAQGHLVKALSFGKTGSGHVVAGGNIALDGTGNLYVGGYYTGSNVDFDPDTGLYKLSYIGSDNNAFVMKLDAAGKFLWAKRWFYGFDEGSNHTLEEGPAMALDGAGNIYSAGRFHTTVDFDPGDSVYNLAGQWYDGYIMKLNTDGEFVWARQFATDTSPASYVHPRSVSVDPTGNIFVAGIFKGTIDFNPDTTAVTNLSATAEIGFLAKLDAAGNLLWAIKVGNDDVPLIEFDEANAVKADASGNAYVTGAFMGTVSFGNTTLESAGAADIFIAKLDGAGNYIWARQIGSIYDAEAGTRLALDAYGDVYITGIYRGTVDFNAGAGANFITTNGSVDVFVLKLNASGDFMWVQGFGGSASTERISGLAVSGSSVYTAGKFYETVNFNPNGVLYVSAADSGSVRADAFIHKINQDVTDINNIPAGMDITLYPNPAANSFFVSLPATREAGAVITLLDVQGQVVTEMHTRQPLTAISVAGLSRGMYLVKVQTESGYAVRRVVVE